jgi:hypothetical protein
LSNIVGLNNLMRLMKKPEVVVEPGTLYTRAQVAQFFQVNKRTLQRWETEGVGPKVTRVGLSVYYRGDSILAALEEGTK